MSLGKFMKYPYMLHQKGDDLSKRWKVVKANKERVETTKWVRIIAHIRNNGTGEIRQSKEKIMWDEKNGCPHTYIWSGGNDSCDCNRGLLFGYAVGNLSGDIKCGKDKYSVNLENPRTGEIFYKEF